LTLVLASVAGCSDGGTGAPAPEALGATSPGCLGAPRAAVDELTERLPGGTTVTGLVAHPATLAPPAPSPHIEVLTAKVTLLLPGVAPHDVQPMWIWADGDVYNDRGDTDLATALLPGFRYAGGRLPAAEQAATRCLNVQLAHHPRQVVTSDITEPLGTLHVSGALNATVHGQLPCILRQVSGTFSLGGGRQLVLSLSNIASATVTHPPGGGPYWLFMPTPDPSDITGIRIGSHAVESHTTIPYDPLERIPGIHPPRDALRLDGALPCQVDGGSS